MTSLKAPPTCLTCSAHEAYTVVLQGQVDTRSRCLKGKPMHSPCAWFEDKGVLREKGNEVRK